MTIVQVTLRHLLRRRWKLPLGVFLCGVVLVGLHHAFDVDGVRQAYSGAIRELPASRSPEQLEVIATWRRIGPVLGTLDAALLIGPFLVGVLMPGGVVANERRSGAIMLWAQHPMPLTRFYMRRYVGIQLANLVGQALIGASFVLYLLTLPPDTATLMERLAESCLHGLLGCAMSFAVSALAVRRASFLVFAYYVASSMSNSPNLSDALTGVSDVLPFLIFPTRTIDESMMGFGATGILLYHFVLWTAVAWVGLRRLERKPLKI